ncbi:MAG TPA: SHOCT domain-containing protein [Patescibacteria group bacterium]|nr:SHOCT domain-containing protein [Patescibacteria group bacterium]
MLEKRNPIQSVIDSFPTNDMTGSLLLLIMLPVIFILWLVSLAIELFLQVIFSVLSLGFQSVSSLFQVKREGGISVPLRKDVSPHEETYMQGKIDELHTTFSALEKLFRLKKEGALSQEEFEQQKSQLLKNL